MLHHVELQWGLHGRQILTLQHEEVYIPALNVVNIISDATFILLPKTLNVVVTVIM